MQSFKVSAGSTGLLLPAVAIGVFSFVCIETAGDPDSPEPGPEDGRTNSPRLPEQAGPATSLRYPTPIDPGVAVISGQSEAKASHASETPATVTVTRDPWRLADEREVASEIAAAGARDLSIYKFMDFSIRPSESAGTDRSDVVNDSSAVIDGEIVDSFEGWYPGKSAEERGEGETVRALPPMVPYFEPTADGE